MTHSIDRRTILLSGGAATTGLLLPSGPAFAQSAHCDLLKVFARKTDSEFETADGWGISFGPDAALELDARAQALEIALADLEANESAATWDVAISGINTLGAIGFAIAGTTATISAPVLFTGSVVFAGTMLVADTLFSPTPPSEIDILTLEANRFVEVVDIMNMPEFSMTGRSNAVIGRAVPIISGLLVAFQIVQLRKQGQAYNQLSDRVDALRAELAAVRATADAMQASAVATEIRRSCLAALFEDIEAISADPANACVDLPPPVLP